MRLQAACSRRLRGSNTVFSPWSPVRTTIVSGPAASIASPIQASMPAIARS